MQSVGSALSVTPSSGHARAIHQTEFERSLSLIDRADRAPLQEASFNSSYLEAIIDDLTRSGAEGTTAPVDTAWERYGRALHRAIAEVLEEFLEEARPLALEIADYWISVGPHDRPRPTPPGATAPRADRGGGGRASRARRGRCGVHRGSPRMRRRGLVSNLYRTARLANDVSALASGNPHRIARRARNRIVGRALATGGFWRMLWGR